ncbi:MAG TPA: ABC transporter permease [Thermoplasmata archaeon]|nr:ABC transporter permease [Thermoplasmata archaeon]
MASRSFRGMMMKRSLYVVLTIMGIVILNFFLIHALPGDPIGNMVPRDPKFPEALKWDLMERFHLNASIEEKFVIYMKNTFTGDWGISYMSNQREVIDIISNDMRWTLLLVGTSTFFTTIFGMAVGAYSAYRRGGTFDISSTSLSLFFYGMPIFWFAILLQILFNSYPLEMDWWPQLPTGGYFDTVTYGSEFEWTLPIVLSTLQHLILPAATLSIATLAGVSLVMRSSLIDVMTEDYITTARAKGLTDGQVLMKHALPNGMPPMVALLAMSIAFVIGGAYQIEIIFNYPGIGYRTINAIWNLDFPILQFIIVVGGVTVVIANFLGDIILLYIDPRIKIA